MINFRSEVEDILREEADEFKEEIDPFHFHASSAGLCKRQIFLKKLNLELQTIKDLGRMRAGTIFHEWLEENLKDRVEADFEVENEVTHDGLKITGRADAVGKREIYDFKTRGGWYKFDPPEEYYMDQLTVYMKMFEMNKARLVYMSKKDMTMKRWPKRTGEVFKFSQERWMNILDKLKQVQEKILEVKVPNSKEEIPFDKCGCYICKKEKVKSQHFGEEIDFCE